MSKGSTPIHSSSPFDPYYEFDPDFTAEISAKMHVPDKICVAEGLQNATVAPNPREEVRNMMNVPERIIVAGGDKHFAVRDFAPELKFDRAFPSTIPSNVLEAPPNVLKVDDYPYPSTEFKKCSPKEPRKKYAILEQPSTITDLNESSMSGIPDDEISMIRKQLRHLSRRVLTLEQESQQRQQREIILYALGITYFVLKGLKWLHRHF